MAALNKQDKIMLAVVTAIIINTGGTIWNATWNYTNVIKSLDTHPPIVERITKLERSSEIAIKEREAIRKADKESLVEIKGLIGGQLITIQTLFDGAKEAREGQFSATAGMIKEINVTLNAFQKEQNKDRVKAAKIEEKVKHSDERIRELHEYRYAPKSRK